MKKMIRRVGQKLGNFVANLAYAVKSMTFIERQDKLPIHKFKDYESYLQAGTRKVWATFKSCDLVAQVVQDTTWSLVSAEGKPVNIPDLQRLLEKPNEFETWSDFAYLLPWHLKLTGNAFIFKDETDFDFNRPNRLFVLNPKHVKIVPDRHEKIRGYIYYVNGEEIPIEPREMIHIKRPHPNDTYYGLGDIEGAEPLFSDFINRNTWTEKFWENGAAPSGLLICEDQIESTEQWEAAKAKFQKQYGGVKNSGKTAWLTGKWKYQQLGMTAAEMQDIERTKMTVEQIFTAHGIPLSVAGIRDAANYATAKIEDVAFRRYTVRPIIRMIQTRLQEDLVRGFVGAKSDQSKIPQLVFNLSGLVDAADAIATYTPLFDRGALSINELRELCGLKRDDMNEQWNQHFINAGLIPLELAGVTDMGKTEEEAKAVMSRFLKDSLDGRLLADRRNGTRN
jgi:HK97 family phage portal protein